jgi:hypothetical protein
VLYFTHDRVLVRRFGLTANGWPIEWGEPSTYLGPVSAAALGQEIIAALDEFGEVRAPNPNNATWKETQKKLFRAAGFRSFRQLLDSIVVVVSIKRKIMGVELSLDKVDGKGGYVATGVVRIVAHEAHQSELGTAVFGLVKYGGFAGPENRP